MTREIPFVLAVRFGNCQRYTETDGRITRRIVSLKCPILRNSLKGEDPAGRGDEIELRIQEADIGEEGIGSFDTLGFLCLTLPPAAFAEFWAATNAVDGAARDIIIQFKKPEPSLNAYIITKAQLVEHMPEAVDFTPKAHAPGYIPGRVHPVVAELRDMRRALGQSWHPILTAFLVAVGFVVMTELISGALRALWRLINP
jgi:hypothetical protein